MRRYPVQRVRFMGVPDSPASSIAPESMYSGNSQTSQHDKYFPDVNLVFERPHRQYSPSIQYNDRPSSLGASSSMTQEQGHVGQSRMIAPRTAPGARIGRVMGFPPPVVSSSSVYSENSPGFMNIRSRHIGRSYFMPEENPFSPSHMGPSSPSTTCPYAPGPSRYRERERIQRKQIYKCKNLTNFKTSL